MNANHPQVASRHDPKKKPSIVLRDITSMDDFRKVEALEKEVWGLADHDVLPLTMIVATKESGNIWIGAFDGLRLIAGFASVTSGFTNEGRCTWELARQGVPLGRAWFRAARHGQASVDAGAKAGFSPPRWAALLAIENRNGSSLDDHLPGHGPDLVDLSRPAQFRGLWTPT